jgi:predicted CxxxxCH...CXXCH cytochrome family protein
MNPTRAHISALAALALAAQGLIACDTSRPIAAKSAASVCTRCHGGTADQSGAPPGDTRGRIDPSLPSVGAHASHVAAGLDCGACHVKPAPGDHSHIDGKVRIVWGALATGNDSVTPDYDRDLGCRSTYCHGDFPGGNRATVQWTAAGQGEARCGTCHGDVSSTLPALPRNHPALAAGSTYATCAACHPDTVDAAGAIRAGGGHVDGVVQIDPDAKHQSGWSNPALHGAAVVGDPRACERCHAVRQPAAVTNVTCADCHKGGQDWTTTCNGCHGSETDPRGAPPRDLSGNTAVSVVGVGAHGAHVNSSWLSAPLDCVFCHRKPADAYDAGHFDGVATVTAYQGEDAAWIAAGKDPGWNRGTATCATSYCHSAYAPANVPVWTQPRAESCGTCHGLPPGAPHPEVASDLAGCGACHPDTMTGSGQMIPPPLGAHLDGRVSVTGGHVAAFMNPQSPEFHAYAANRGLSTCRGCHAPDLSGGFTGVSCATCHGASWKTSCTMCHGGLANQTGAPPTTIWGYDADAVRVGGHTVHVSGGALGRPIDCALCHPMPPDALAPGHIDTVTGAASPAANVVFTGLATQGIAAPTWNRATPTCNVYCHGGAFSSATKGSNTAPAWTGGPGAAVCGTCHALPPGGGHPANARCGGCHGDGYGAGTVDPAIHLNGRVDVGAMTCTSCHGDSSRLVAPAAPPADTFGSTSSSRVGAHQAHLQDGALRAALPCTECHALPTSVSHADGVTDFAWGELARGVGTAGGTTAPAYVGGACSGTYCHGANLNAGGTNQAPSWAGGAAAVQCGTCHGAPPPQPHPNNPDCGRCHAGYTSTTVARSSHVNGRLEVELNCTSCHGDATRVPVAGSDSNVAVAPPVTATGRSPGAHLAHVNPAAPKMTPARCEECHAGKVPGPSTAHPSGVIDVQLGGRATLGGAVPSYGPSTGCSATYCHGNYSGVYEYAVWDYANDVPEPRSWSYAGNAATPSWTGGALTCGSCHGNPPPGYWHSRTHGSSADHRACETCHPSAAGNNVSGGIAITNAALHIDGKVDVKGKTSACRGCH